MQQNAGERTGWWWQMRLQMRNVFLGLCLLALAASCTTVRSITSSVTGSSRDYSDIPEAEIRSLAREIEGAIASGNREPEIANSESFRIDDPRIEQAIRSRAARFQLIDDYRSMGFSWERRNGRLWIRKSREYSDATTSAERNRYAFLVYSENEDRWRLYEALLDVNGMNNSKLGAIEEIFFEARLEFMKPGQIYETSEGEPAVLVDLSAPE